jgi:hypothetical protein
MRILLDELEVFNLLSPRYNYPLEKTSNVRGWILRKGSEADTMKIT